MSWKEALNRHGGADGEKGDDSKLVCTFPFVSISAQTTGAHRLVLVIQSLNLLCRPDPVELA